MYCWSSDNKRNTHFTHNEKSIALFTRLLVISAYVYFPPGVPQQSPVFAQVVWLLRIGMIYFWGSKTWWELGRRHCLGGTTLYLTSPYQNTHTQEELNKFTLNPLSSVHLSKGIKIFMLPNILCVWGHLHCGDLGTHRICFCFIFSGVLIYF